VAAARGVCPEQSIVREKYEMSKISSKEPRYLKYRTAVQALKLPFKMALD
jgi:hypothetical protein